MSLFQEPFDLDGATNSAGTRPQLRDTVVQRLVVNCSLGRWTCSESEQEEVKYVEERGSADVDVGQKA